mgnify:FL=1
MEIEKNNLFLKGLSNYIRVYDNILPEEVIKNFYKICKENKNFKDSKIVYDNGTDGVDKKVRDTKIWPLKNLNEKSKTSIHWCNLLLYSFTNKVNEYIGNSFSCQILEMQVLRYKKNGHYTFHIDHSRATPRTLSCIFFVNEDYEGGELIFKTPTEHETLKIDKKANRLIIWPSNFLYPHTVMPVIEGIRYSVVTWAL